MRPPLNSKDTSRKILGNLFEKKEGKKLHSDEKIICLGLLKPLYQVEFNLVASRYVFLSTMVLALRVYNILSRVNFCKHNVCVKNSLSCEIHNKEREE